MYDILFADGWMLGRWGWMLGRWRWSWRRCLVYLTFSRQFVSLFKPNSKKKKRKRQCSFSRPWRHVSNVLIYMYELCHPIHVIYNTLPYSYIIYYYYRNGTSTPPYKHNCRLAQTCLNRRGVMTPVQGYSSLLGRSGHFWRVIIIYILLTDRSRGCWRGCALCSCRR